MPTPASDPRSDRSWDDGIFVMSVADFRREFTRLDISQTFVPRRTDITETEWRYVARQVQGMLTERQGRRLLAAWRGAIGSASCAVWGGGRGERRQRGAAVRESWTA